MAGRVGLLAAHRLLIAMAIGLSAILLARGIAAYVAHQDAASLGTGIAATFVGVGLSVYLRWFVRKQR
jgi:hypothetical protein